MNENIATVQGKWEEATVKLQGFDSKMENVRAQLQSITQELDNKLSNDEALLRNRVDKCKRCNQNWMKWRQGKAR